MNWWNKLVLIKNIITCSDNLEIQLGQYSLRVIQGGEEALIVSTVGVDMWCGHNHIRCGIRGIEITGKTTINGKVIGE